MVAIMRKYHNTPKGKAFIKKVYSDFQSPDINIGAGTLGSAPKDLAKYYRLQLMLKNPSKAFAQTRENLATNKGVEGFIDRFKGVATPSEYRIHVINGKVVPGTSLARQTYLQEALDVLGVPNPDMRKAEKWLEATLAQMPKNKLKGKSFGFDAAPLQGGGFRAMESNPTNAVGASGFLWTVDRKENLNLLKKLLASPGRNWRELLGADRAGGEVNPLHSPLLQAIGHTLNSHRQVSALQGRNTHLLAALKAGLAGGAGLGTYGAYQTAR